MSASRKLWLGLGALLLASFSVLLWVGGEIHRVMPPIPSAVVTTDGTTIYTRDDIRKGRQVWQSIGGHQLGSIWGHGSYVAPDWTADWLHREALAWLDIDARHHMGRTYAELAPEEQASFDVRLRSQIRENTYNRERDTSRLRLIVQRRWRRSPATTRSCSATIPNCWSCAKRMQ